MAAYYLNIKSLHMGTAVVSVVLLLIRAGLLSVNSPLFSLRSLRILPHVVNTLLLVSAFMLAVIVQQRPFADDWLTVKLLALVVYVALGVIAMRSERPAPVRLTALAAALATFAFIMSVAVTRDPFGFLG